VRETLHGSPSTVGEDIHSPLFSGGRTVPHTPGPWHIDIKPIESTGGGNKCYLIGPFQACIYDDWRNAERGISGAELYANATLMGAAPDLLAACCGMLEFIRAYPSLGFNDYLVNEIEDAIDKAKGGT
jgi:hypothetical protein